MSPNAPNLSTTATTSSATDFASGGQNIDGRTSRQHGFESSEDERDKLASRLEEELHRRNLDERLANLGKLPKSTEDKWRVARCDRRMKVRRRHHPDWRVVDNARCERLQIVNEAREKAVAAERGVAEAERDRNGRMGAGKGEMETSATWWAVVSNGVAMAAQSLLGNQVLDGLNPAEKREEELQCWEMEVEPMLDDQGGEEYSWNLHLTKQEGRVHREECMGPGNGVRVKACMDCIDDARFLGNSVFT